jgi:hypothetical protein
MGGLDGLRRGVRCGSGMRSLGVGYDMVGVGSFEISCWALDGFLTGGRFGCETSVICGWGIGCCGG